MSFRQLDTALTQRCGELIRAGDRVRVLTGLYMSCEGSVIEFDSVTRKGVEHWIVGLSGVNDDGSGTVVVLRADQLRRIA